MDNTNILTAEKTVIPPMAMKFGRTTFDVHVHFSETSKETMTDKLLRLIKNDIRAKKI